MMTEKDNAKGADDASNQAASVKKVEKAAQTAQEAADTAKSTAAAVGAAPKVVVPGSPVTAGTGGENDPGNAGVDATKGNFSPTAVAGVVDNSPATGPGDHANISAPTQDPKNPNVVKPNDLAGNTSQLQAKVDGTSPEVAGTTDYVDEKPHDPYEEVADHLEKDLDRIDQREGPIFDAVHKIYKLVNVMNATTPDSMTVYGYGGVILTLGDLRALTKGIPNGYFDED